MTMMKVDEQIAGLTKHLNTLNAQIKEKQVTLKSLEQEVMTAQQRVDKELKEMESHTLQRMHDLQAKVQPLTDEVTQLESQRQAYIKERQSRLDQDLQQWRSLKSEKLAELRGLDQQIAEKMNRLVSLQQSIEDCKQRVAAI